MSTGRFIGPHSDLTNRIISCALAVHGALGSGFVESVYENALALEFARNDLAFEKQRQVTITYLGQPVGVHRLDMLVENTVIAELKAKDSFSDADYAAVLSYLKATDMPVALMLNFGTPELQIKRLVNTKQKLSPRHP